jgi:hypothetical protein
MYRVFLAAVASLSLLSFASAPTQARTVSKGRVVQAVHPHQHLHHALWELRLAAHELQKSPVNFAGHLDKAVQAMHSASKRIEIMLAAVADNTVAAPSKRDLTVEYKKYATHPHLHHVLHELRHAHNHLKATRFEYGGHREAGLREVHQAHQEVEALLKYAKMI